MVYALLCVLYVCVCYCFLSDDHLRRSFAIVYMFMCCCYCAYVRVDLLRLLSQRPPHVVV